MTPDFPKGLILCSWCVRTMKVSLLEQEEDAILFQVEVSIPRESVFQPGAETLLPLSFYRIILNYYCMGAESNLESTQHKISMWNY